MKGILLRLSVVAVLLAAVLAVKPIVLGGAANVTLQPAPLLSGAVSQAFTSSGLKTLPVINKDYSLDLHYFDDSEWVVATIKPITNAVTDGMVILHRQNGVYVAALGPGSAFPATAIESLPNDISTYLNDSGVVYVPD